MEADRAESIYEANHMKRNKFSNKEYTLTMDKSQDHVSPKQPIIFVLQQDSHKTPEKKQAVKRRLNLEDV